MADKQFIKGAITGVLCASLVLGGGYVGLQKAGRAGSNVLSDVAVTQKIKYLEDIIDQNYLEDVDEDSLKEGIYTGLLYGLGDPYSRYYRLQFAFICPFPHQSGMSSFNVIVAFSL